MLAACRPAFRPRTRFTSGACWLAALGLSGALVSAAPLPVAITVHVDQPGAKLNPAMWGVFFEDINFAADGGLYAELVKNRSFEFPEPLMGWSPLPAGKATTTLEIRDDAPFHPANPHYLRLTAPDADRNSGVANEGFRGMGIRADAGYVFSVQLRAAAGSPALRIELVDRDGRQLATTRIDNVSRDWQLRTARLRSTATESKARLQLHLEGAGAADLDMVSLFPEATWKQRPNGLRLDLVQMLADLKPGFVKFPGGFLTEGRRLATRYQWKSTLGDLAERKLLINAFNQFPTHPAPDYFQSFGLGFFELFQLCEDLGAEPQPVISCGMAAQFSGEMAPLDQLDPYIQDALDLVEFANGPVDSHWGGVRTRMGHPAPFHLKMLRLGNEQHGPDYVARCRRLIQAIKARYPEITVIAGTGPDPAGDGFALAWEQLGHGAADILDEHSHNQPPWFYRNASRFDAYDRARSKVMVGEYCAHTRPGLISPDNRNNLASALSEAAFLTGVERNADVVVMASACALFAHVDAWQWTPNLIWFDNFRVYGTPNYYVQQLFSCNRGDVVLPVDLRRRDDDPCESFAAPIYVSATRATASGEVILKVVNPQPDPQVSEVCLSGASRIGDSATLTVLSSAQLEDENSLDAPTRILPKASTCLVLGRSFRCIFPARSLTVLKLKAE